MKALPEKETIELRDADVEGHAESEAKEPVKSGVALVVPARDPDGVVLPNMVGLAPTVAVADGKPVTDTVPLLLLVVDALWRVELVDVEEGEDKLDVDAAAEAVEGAEAVTTAVTEGLLVVVGEEDAALDAKALAVDGAVALALALPPLGDCEPDGHGVAEFEVEAETVGLSEPQAVPLCETVGESLTLAVQEAALERERIVVDV